MNWALLQRTLCRRKTLAQAAAGVDIDDNNNNNNSTETLRRSLTAVDLILYGVGSSVGAGIYVLVGLGAKTAGPAISLSFLACGLACILTSLCYAEFAARIAVTGSAFVYAYVAFGELTAWLVGWNLTLGYGFTTSVVARAWADYLGNFLIETLSGNHFVTKTLPWLLTTIQYTSELPIFGTTVPYTCSPLSIVIVWAGTLILLRGVKDSSTFNNVMTVMNISVLILVVVAGMGSIESDNLTPFMPHSVSGVVAGAGLVFFAFIGFDMVASLSEEVIHPEKNMPIGIVGSLIVSTCIYVSVALTVVGMAPINVLGETVPVINALLANACCTHSDQLLPGAEETCLAGCVSYDAKPWLAVVGRIVSVGAIMGLKASCFTSLMGQPRILYSLSREGLIPPIFMQVNPITQVPDKGIILTGIVTAALACFAPMESLANLISLGTLMVFTLVNVGVLFLRLQQNMNPVVNVPKPVPSKLSKGEMLSIIPPATKDPSSFQQLHHLHHQQQSTHAYKQEKRPGTPSTATSTPSSSFFVLHRRKIRQERRIVIRWILTFTFATLSSSLCFSNPSVTYPVIPSLLAWSFVIVSFVAAYQVIILPPSWSCLNSSTNPQTSAPNNLQIGESSGPVHNVFSCPLVPVIPLTGIACNTFMMGSLPLQSWILCVVWMGLGTLIYFFYGMHHAVLNSKDNDEALPLVPVHDDHEQGITGNANQFTATYSATDHDQS